MHVSTHTLEIFCSILQCPVEDIMEITPEPFEVDKEEKEPDKVSSGTE